MKKSQKVKSKTQHIAYCKYVTNIILFLLVILISAVNAYIIIFIPRESRLNDNFLKSETTIISGDNRIVNDINDLIQIKKLSRRATE